ncbi:thiamine diphosphokinase [Virgibacillus flavescens]|uniref:thiamine diphosphokinase n=1 Tax=Virgibacillus flavescens TaxID=1611422 RepID=UPI003D34CDF6
MITIGIVANGPKELIPNLFHFRDEIDIWIGADRGALLIADKDIRLDYALGDFDSIDENEENKIKESAVTFKKYPSEKNQTDIELAIEKALELQADTLYLFGVTGGRLDHELINFQMLYMLNNRSCKGIIIDKFNHVELFLPGTHHIVKDEDFPNISLVPFSENVRSISLTGFYYPLKNFDLNWGSSRCISNKLLLNNGTFSFDEGILLLIKSCDG